PIRNEQSAVGREALKDRVAERDRRRSAARADESDRRNHGSTMIFAPTGSIRVIHASLVMPSAANASTMPARTSSAFTSSAHANIVGPAPEIEQPSAPRDIAAFLTA